MRTLYLVRHAQSESNASSISRADRDIAFTPLGMAQAAQLAERLPQPAAVYCSELKRTRQTAAPYLARWQQQACIVPELNEFSYPACETVTDKNGKERRLLAGTYWQEASSQRQTIAAAHTMPDSFAGFIARVARWRRCLAPELPNGSFSFTHGLWLAMLIWQLLGHPCKNSDDMRCFRAWQRQLPMPNTATFALTIMDTGIMSLRFLPHYCVAAVPDSDARQP